MKNKTTAGTQTARSKNNGSNNKIVSYPAPKPLATPNGLKPEEVREIVEAVNPLIADALRQDEKLSLASVRLAFSRIPFIV